jgi:hypothetical protein
MEVAPAGQLDRVVATGSGGALPGLGGALAGSGGRLPGSGRIGSGGGSWERGKSGTPPSPGLP